MPRQKLSRKSSRRPGKQGQAQKPGPHDPEHQQGKAEEELAKETRPRGRSEAEDDDQARMSRKESPL